MKLTATKILILLTILLLGNEHLQAQDVHFSQNYATPLFLNPAMTGLMNGDTRASVIYRNQWAAISPQAPFRTIGLSADMAFRGVRDADRFAFGIMAYSDKGGDLGYGVNYADLAFAYNLSFTPQLYLSVGTEVGFTQRGFDISKAQFGDMYDPDLGSVTGSSPDQAIDPTAQWSANVAGGAMVYYSANHRTNFYLGGGMFHLTRPEIALQYNESLSNVFTKLTIQLGGSVPLGDVLDIVPSAYFTKQGLHTKLEAGSFFRFLFDTNDRYQLDKAISIGSWLRIGDDLAEGFSPSALIFAGRVEYDYFSVGLSYDWTLMTLAPYNANRGGIEIAVVYTGRNQKQNSQLHCPRF